MTFINESNVRKDNKKTRYNNNKYNAYYENIC